MTNTARNASDRHRTPLGLVLSLASLGPVWLGFHVGDLGQRIRRAHEVLRGVHAIPGSGATELELITNGLLDASRSIFAVRRWLFVTGLCALLLLALLDWASVRVRVAAVLMILVCWSLLVLTSAIP
jgi:hypothetical protein